MPKCCPPSSPTAIPPAVYQGIHFINVEFNSVWQHGCPNTCWNNVRRRMENLKYTNGIHDLTVHDGWLLSQIGFGKKAMPGPTCHNWTMSEDHIFACVVCQVYRASLGWTSGAKGLCSGGRQRFKVFKLTVQRMSYTVRMIDTKLRHLQSPHMPRVRIEIPKGICCQAM